MSRIKNWFITQLCRTSLGFKVAYRLGLARPGIDFVDVDYPTAYDGFWILTPRSLSAIEFDFKNKEHVKRLIYIQKEFIPDDDVSILLFDLDMTIEKLYKMRSLTKHQYEIIKMIRQGYKNIEICNK